MINYKELLKLIKTTSPIQAEDLDIKDYIESERGHNLLMSITGFLDSSYDDGIESIIDNYSWNEKLKKENKIDLYIDYYSFLKHDIELLLENFSDSDIFEIFNFMIFKHIPAGWCRFGFPEEAQKLLDDKSDLWARVFLERIYFDVYKNDPDFRKDLIKYIKV